MSGSYRSTVGSTLLLVRGAALGIFLGAVLFAVALVLGLASGTNRLLFVLAALAGVIFASIPAGDSVRSAIGAGGLAVASVGVGVFTGFGWLEICMVAGAGLAILSIILRPGSELAFSGVRAGWMGLAGVGVVLLALVPLVIGGETLGHDESAYALKGRAWFEGTPETGWSIHRGPALSVYAYGVLALGGEEPALRSIGWLALAGLAAATWWLGVRIGGRWVGALSAVAVVSGPMIQRRATEHLTDIPAAALLVVCTVIVWREFSEREAPTYRLLMVLPFAWLAFYLRYQSLLAFGLIGLTVLVLWWRKVARRPGPLVLAVAIGALGLVPHVRYSIEETGSPIGILSITGQAAGRRFLGEGLVDYAGILIWPLAGFLGLGLMVFFLWWLGASWKDVDSRKRVMFLLIPSVGQVIALGVLAHGEPRFVFFPLALGAVGGVSGYFALREKWRPVTRRALGLGFVMLLVGSLALSVASTRRSVDNRILVNEPVQLAARWVADESQQMSCAVMTSYTPQVTFYSGCSTDIFRSHLEADKAVERLQGDIQFMVLVEDGKRQPQDNELDELVALTTGDPVDINGERYSAEVYEFEP